MLEKDLVSIIVPVYNTEKYVKKCLQSIKNQTYKNIEVIVIDDGSIDNSLAVCEEVIDKDNRFILIHQENKGVVSARGEGLKKAAGQFVMFVDSDDWIESNMIDFFVNNILDADILIGGNNQQNKYGKYIKRTNSLLPKEYFPNQILSRCMYDFNNENFRPIIESVWGKLYKLSLIKEIYFDIDPSIRVFEDAVILYKYLIKCKKVKITEESLYNYAWNDTSITRQSMSDALININKVYNSLKEEFEISEFKEILMLQLQKWVILMTNIAINVWMRFDIRLQNQLYIVNTKGLENKRVILYGAGVVGRGAYKQLKTFEYNIVLWVDKDYKEYKKYGFDVSPIEEIKNTEFDVIYIAVKDEKVVENIKYNLIKIGISLDKIVWNEPMNINS